MQMNILSRLVLGGYIDLKQGMVFINFLVNGNFLSAQSENVEPFKTRLAHLINLIIEEESYSKHQIFNSDDIGLNWRVLQSVTLADGTEKHARGFKDRVTFLDIANASGDFHLPC